MRPKNAETFDLLKQDTFGKSVRVCSQKIGMNVQVYSFVSTVIASSHPNRLI